jgi:GntR family transcriptional repressor for pyruvate dehydrogenase complex
MERFERFPRSTLPEEIANRLLGLIREQELKPGDKLPAERDLAQQMGVSRPVLREALRALALMRVVDIRHGAGTYITSLEPELLISHLDFVFPKDSIALLKLSEARRVVEIGNVRLAAVRITADELGRLEALVASLRAALDTPARFGELDIEFHTAVGEAAENFLLSQFMSIVNTLGRVSRERTGGSPAVRAAALRDHRAILAALQANDPDAAEEAMGRHLDRVEVALRAVSPPATAQTGAAVAAGGRS